MNKIAPQSGTSLKLKKGEYLKVVCPEGEQVADLVAYRDGEMTEFLSNGKTFDYEETIFLTIGNILYSNKSKEMLEIVLDTCGRHDFLLAPCCPDTFKKLYDKVTEHPSCRNNLAESLNEYGIEAHTIPTAFNIFMKVDVNKEGKLKVQRPAAKAGDQIIFRAHMDMVIGLTACSAEKTNNGSLKSIDYQVLTLEEFSKDPTFRK